MMDIQPAEGTASEQAYLVAYNEDLWFSYSEETREFCKETWIRKAEPLNVRFVVLRLTPDPVFPMRGHEKPYVEWRHMFPPKTRLRPATLTFDQLKAIVRTGDKEAIVEAAIRYVGNI